MSLKRDKSGKLHITSPLMGESLMDKQLLEDTGAGPVFKIMPNLIVVKIGGQSIIDRGKSALIPILEELVEARKHHELLITTGGGTRARHVYAIATELGMPAGVLSSLASSISEQNALMVAMVLGPEGGIKIGHDDLTKLSHYLRLGCLPVTHAMPPYGLFETPPEMGRIPPHRTDAGVFLMAEVLGAKKCILIKDEHGVYEADPKKDEKARFLGENIEVKDLLALNLNDLPVERSMLECLVNSRSMHEFTIVNGLVRGNITRAISGEKVGTTIYKAC